jgi:aromatic ring-opening dioxygenase catalytic subunit (LigB family)
MGKIVLTAYISHGAPTLLTERSKIHDVYEDLGGALEGRGVDTVVISSPHYFSRDRFEVESRECIPCIQDYLGFPQELYKFSYEARNNLNLVSEILVQSKSIGIEPMKSQLWGLDHGAWLPLHFMFPKRDVKVVPVSIADASPGDHFKFGAAIKSAVEKIDGTVAVIGTGSPLHRLDLIRYGYYGEERFKPGESFDKELITIIRSGDFEKVQNIQNEFPSLFRAAAPEGSLSPLYFALGASDRKDFIGETVLHEFMYYGVSLVAMILSAEKGVRNSLASFETDRVTA